MILSVFSTQIEVFFSCREKCQGLDEILNENDVQMQRVSSTPRSRRRKNTDENEADGNP